MSPAPIALSTYSRLPHLKQTIEALKANAVAKESDLYILSDAAKPGDEERVGAVRKYIDTINGFKNVHLIKRKKNSRVENNRNGLSDLLKRFGKCIYIEEDIVTAPGFLTFMNAALDTYRHNDKIFSISGYAPPIDIPADYRQDTFILRRACAWGMGIWRDRFEKITYMDHAEVLKRFSAYKEVEALTKYGEDLLKMVLLDAAGKIDALDVKIFYHQYLNDEYTVYPRKSLVKNIGFDGSGVHCEPSNRFEVDLWDRLAFNIGDEVALNARIVDANYEFRKLANARKATGSAGPSIKKSPPETDHLGKNLLFLISQPRAGSTMLQKVLGGHSDIDTTSEPWIMLHPVFALKQQQLKAPFEPHLAEMALEDFVSRFPEKIDLFFEAVRCYAQTFYRRSLAASQKTLFLDKTPRYYMIMPELIRCFPEARFIILLRNPMAVLSSMLISWFKNNPSGLMKSRCYNDLIDAPQMLLDGLKRLGKNGYVVHYENLVRETENEISRLCRWLDIGFEPGMLRYGHKNIANGRLGDQIGVSRYGRPVTDSVEKWKLNLKNPDLNQMARHVIQSIGNEAITNMGYRVEEILNALSSDDPFVVGYQNRSNRELADQSGRGPDTRRRIIIDGVIFQLQSGKAQGISSVWRSLVPELMRQLPDFQITVLQRDGFPIPIKGVNIHTVPAFRPECDTKMDEDDEMLRQACRDLKAGLFLSTWYTRAPGVKNMVMVHDLIPEKRQFDLSSSEWASKQRAVETADALICGSPARQNDLVSFYPQVVNRPMIDLPVGRDACQDLQGFIKAMFGRPSVLLTAIVSTYNSARFIKGCLEDLEQQTIAGRLEIIVVDSASQEDEAAVVRDFQRRYANIKYIRTQDRESVYQAWNRGIKFALGKYISNANTDDRHRQDAFEQMVHVLEQDENIALAYADVIKTQTANETFRHCTPAGMFHWYDWDRGKLLEKGCFIGPQPVWRKAVHQDYGYFDENYKVSADFDFWLKISQTNEFYHISKPLGLYMDRPDSIEHANAQKKQREDQEILQRYRQAEKDKSVIGMLSRSDQHLNTECRQTQQDDAAHAAESVQCRKSTREEITQGGNAMHSPETIFKAIEHLVANGHKEAALWAMGKLLADFPKHARLHNEMAALAYEQAHMPEALLHFKQAAALDPQNTIYLKNLGDYYYVQEKDAESALTQYESVLNLDPNNLEALVMAGHVSISLHRYSLGRQYYQRVLDLDPQNEQVRQIVEKITNPALDQNSGALSADDLYAAAQAKARKGDRQTAISMLEQLLSRDDAHAQAHNDLGVLQFESGNLQAALDHYEKAAGLQPENETLQKNLADFYLAALGDPERAMQAYVQVLKLNPRDVEALLSCGQVCMHLGKAEDARDFIDMALETEPWSENAQHMLRRLDQPMEAPDPAGTDLYAQAKAKASEGDLHGAIDDLGKYVTAAPDNANAHNDLGVLCFEAGDKDKALEAYEQAVQLAPHDHTYLKNLADFYLIEQSRTEEAMKLYLRVLEDNPQDIESLIAGGLVCTSLGQVEDAKMFYHRVIEIEPGNEIAQNALNGLNPAGQWEDTEGASSAAAG